MAKVTLKQSSQLKRNMRETLLSSGTLGLQCEIVTRLYMNHSKEKHPARDLTRNTTSLTAISGVKGSE